MPESKPQFYSELAAEVAAIMDEVWLTNLSNAAAVLMQYMPQLNWAGFYIMHGGRLVLGPFQGKPACLFIPVGRGVCGLAAKERRTIVVADVSKFSDHIACDSDSKSEIVVPLIKDGRLLGVLDVDSPVLERFDEHDRAGLEKIAATIVDKTRWPDPLL